MRDLDGTPPEKELYVFCRDDFYLVALEEHLVHGMEIAEDDEAS